MFAIYQCRRGGTGQKLYACKDHDSHGRRYWRSLGKVEDFGGLFSEETSDDAHTLGHSQTAGTEWAYGVEPLSEVNPPPKTQGIIPGTVHRMLTRVWTDNCCGREVFTFGFWQH